MGKIYDSMEVERRVLAAELLLLSLVTLFLAVNSLAFNLTISDHFAWSVFRPMLIWFVLIAAAMAILNRFKPNHDPYIFSLFAFLTGWGLLLQRRLAPAFITRQIIWFLLSITVLLLVTVLPRNLRLFRRYRYTFLTLGILLLVVTLLFGINPTGYGAALWLKVPFVNAYFQPSELVKLLIVFFFASYFADKGYIINERHKRGFRAALPYLAPLALMWGFCIVLLIWQRDMGAATIFFVLFLAMLYTATGQERYLLIGAIMLLIASVIGYYAYDLIALRIDAWFNPWPDVYGRSFQIVQSLYALAEGGISGEGIGQGLPTFIPVVHSDFVFAAIAEEWGLIGTMTTVACFAILAQRGLHIAMSVDNRFHMYLAIGMTTLISVQALLIMGGVTKLVPLTGVTLPFLSYGGSSLVVVSLMVGLLLYLDTASKK